MNRQVHLVSRTSAFPEASIFQLVKKEIPELNRNELLVVERYPEGRKQLKEWFLQGQIKPCQTIVEGLESIPDAFIGLFSGKNLGKLLVKVVG